MTLAPRRLAPLLALLALGCDAADTAALDVISADVLSAVPEVGAPLSADAETDSAADAAETGPDARSHDETLRLHQIQVKGTHNSYHVASDPLITPEWGYTHPPLDVQVGELGVRHLELDLHRPPGEGYVVQHVPILDPGSTCATFVDCLGVLRAWSDEHTAHVTFFVTVELKHPPAPAAGEEPYLALEEEVLSVWPRERIVTPDEVRGSHTTLREAVLAGAWPTLAASRGRILFALQWQSQNEGHRALYVADRPSLEGRLMFVRSGSDQVGAAYEAIREIGGPEGREEEIHDLVRAGFLVRTHADGYDPEGTDGHAERAAAALRSGAQLIASHFPTPADDGSYSFSLPDGTPARCNPVNAPPDCRAEDVEAL